MWNTSDHGDGGRAHPRHRISRPVRVVAAAILLVGAAVLGLDFLTPTGSTQTGEQQRGFALPSWHTNGYDGPDVQQSLRETKNVGATWVQFTPTWYQQNRYSNEMARTSGTVSDAGVDRAVTLAHQQGLKVFLKPHIDLPVPGQDSRNNIAPTDRGRWFAAYTDFITHYASMAQRLGVEQFAVATELSSVTDDRAAWLNVIQAVRDRYDGAITYAAGRDWERVPFWDAVDLIGIDSYLPLGAAPTDDVQALRRGWEPVLSVAAALAAKHDRRILFTEAGYTSQRGTITDPSNWRISTTPDQAEQAAGYEALLAALNDQPWWAGVYWWVWITPPDTEAEPLDFSPRGKAAEAVIRRWWAT
jgi:hypothetical protein